MQEIYERYYFDRSEQTVTLTFNTTTSKKPGCLFLFLHTRLWHTDISSMWSESCLCWDEIFTFLNTEFQNTVDMDMSYTRVLHIKVAHRASHKWRHTFYVTRPLLCARITCYVTVITVEMAAAMRVHNVLCNSYLRHTTSAMRVHNVLCNSYNSITVEMNRCSFRHVRFFFFYIVTHLKIV
jgi:hypothetical protein